MDLEKQLCRTVLLWWSHWSPIVDFEIIVGIGAVGGDDRCNVFLEVKFEAAILKFTRCQHMEGCNQMHMKNRN
jgi:hypothetical protein